MDDFTKFGRFVLAVGSNKETYDLLVSWLGELSVCKNFLEFPNLSELISLVLEFYNSNDETIQDCGKKMIHHLIYSTYLISKDTITVFPLFHDMSSSMKKEDPIYSKLRNNLCRMVCLCEENIKEALLKFYISEIFAEALNGIKRYAESYVMMNDASYLAGVIMLPSIIHQFSNESKSDVSIGFDLLLSMLDLLLLKDVGDFNDKKSFLAFLHHLNIFNRLSRVIGAEDRVSSVIEGRSDSVLEIALKAVELDMVMLMESYLQYGNLMERFLEQLLMDFDSILGRRVSREGLILFNRMLLLIKRISKNVQSREEQIRTFLASRTDEVSLMAILFEVFNDKFCSDENLLKLERSICEVDPEFRMELLQTVIPQIDSGSSLI